MGLGKDEGAARGLSVSWMGGGVTDEGGGMDEGVRCIGVDWDA